MWYIYTMECSVQFSLVAQSCPTLCDPVDCTMPVLSVHQQLLELTQIHIHWVEDAIKPSSSPAFSLSQHKGLFFSFFLSFFFFLNFIFTLFYFTVLYGFCHTLTWIHHGCISAPNPESPSHLPPHIISLDHPHARAPSILYLVSNIHWSFFSYMIVYIDV